VLTPVDKPSQKSDEALGQKVDEIEVSIMGYEPPRAVRENSQSGLNSGPRRVLFSKGGLTFLNLADPFLISGHTLHKICGHLQACRPP
jgi:hypothetical protein